MNKEPTRSHEAAGRDESGQPSHEPTQSDRMEQQATLKEKFSVFGFRIAGRNIRSVSGDDGTSNRSAALLKLGHHQAALDDAEKACELNPKWPKIVLRA
ncbi:hypothetical protein Q5P01_014712 [Channa striata]|uniref:Uncharacterized protein n=1 Tax=Channa striata TaxID=64152 RepID=A0AA88SFI4_CHASR|nr:hypothetical protein Q5P01_014712 [Channa striata]